MELSSKTKEIVAIQEFQGKGNLAQGIQGHGPLRRGHVPYFSCHIHSHSHSHSAFAMFIL